MSIFRRISNLFSRAKIDREIVDELRAHIEMRVEENIAAGMAPEEARRNATLRFGNPVAMKEKVAGMDAALGFDNFLTDIRYAFRRLRSSPGFTITAILTLALGIGANVAVFNVFDAVLMRPLPFPQSDQLVSLQELDMRKGAVAMSEMGPSFPDFFDWRSQNKVFSAVAVHHGTSFLLTGNREAQHIEGERVSAEFFQILGVRPLIGRGFTRQEEQPGHMVAVLSYRLWKSRFHADPGIVGRSIDLDGKLYIVTGVMPSSFEFPFDATPPQIWSVFDPQSEDIAERGSHTLEAFARLKTGVTIPEAAADMNQIARALAAAYPDKNTYLVQVRVQSEQEFLVGNTRPVLTLLLGAVMFVLLIACLNVANLMLIRNAERQHEIAVRSALGATRFRIVSQLFLESLLLSAFGGLLALAFVAGSLGAIAKIAPQQVLQLYRPTVHWPVLIFAGMVSLTSSVLFGLLPAFKFSLVNPNTALHQSSRTSSPGIARSKLHGGLIIAETALSILLLIGSGLLIRSFARLLAVNPGFNPRHVLTFNLDLPSSYSDPQMDSLYRRLFERLLEIPGVRDVAGAVSLPFSPSNRMGSGFEVQEHPSPIGSWPTADLGSVTAGYFKVLQIPLIHGRYFSERDTTSSKRVVVVSQEFARRFFPGEDPIGKLIKPGFYTSPDTDMVWREVVGVVGDVKQNNLRTAAAAEYYVPYQQGRMSDLTICIRTSGDPVNVIPPVRAAVRELDGAISVYRVQTMQEYLSAAVSQPRFATILLTAFAALALLLAAIGLYGVLANTVAQRTHEIGIRLALGAQQPDILHMILSKGLILTSAGAAIGWCAALALSRFLDSQIFGISRFDYPTFIAAFVILGITAAIASLIPARRATSVDPMQALRSE